MKKYLLMSCLAMLASPAYADVEGFVNSARGGDIAVIQNYLKQGENINAKNSLGNTALHYAVASDNVELVKFLLENGADATVQNDKGWTPLAIAEKKNLTDIVKVFDAEQNNKNLSDLVEKASAKASDAGNEVAKKAESAKDVAVAKTEEVKEKVATKTDEVKNEVKKAAENMPVPQAPVNVAPAQVGNQAPAVLPPAPMPAPQMGPQFSKPEPKTVQPVQAKPKPKLVPSEINSAVFAGDEEIVYCLYYLGLQTEQHNLVVASEFFAGSSTVDKARYQQISGLAHAYYDNASDEEARITAGKCARVITPQDREKQNQIVRAMNKAAGY